MRRLVITRSNCDAKVVPARSLTGNALSQRRICQAACKRPDVKNTLSVAGDDGNRSSVDKRKPLLNLL